MKSHLSKIVSIILAISIVVCSFASCNIAIEEEPALIKPDVIEPAGDDVLPEGNGGGTVPGEQDFNNNFNPDNGGTGGGSNNGGSNNGGSNNGGSGFPGISGIGGNIPQIDWEGTYKDFQAATTPEKMREYLKTAGYEYDAQQNIFYTHLNPWQRMMGFTDLYDLAAPITNMWYLTLKVDFSYGDYDWRLQWWKGQYGVLEGAELGVYTRDLGSELDFYDCAADENLLRMEMEYYQSVAKYNNGDRLFIRKEQEHWWLTGFKFGVTEPKTCVVVATLYARDEDMADKIEIGLQNVTDEKGNPNGFVPYAPGSSSKDFYIRQGNVFKIVWQKAGYVNYYYIRDYVNEQQQGNGDLPA